jgi:DNA adenine methylase
MSRPILRYHGGKFRIADWVLAFFPPHKVYVEPFGGAASVLLSKQPCPTEVYNDMDSRVVTLFRVLRDETKAAELARRLSLTPFAREEYEGWCYAEPADDIDAAHQIVARGFMGQSSKGIWQRSGLDTRVNPDGYCSRINALRATPEACLAAAKRLSSVLIEHDDAIAVMRRHDRPDALIYCDPPYLTPEGRGTRIYTHDFDQADHRALKRSTACRQWSSSAATRPNCTTACLPAGSATSASIWRTAAGSEPKSFGSTNHASPRWPWRDRRKGYSHESRRFFRWQHESHEHGN